MNTKTVSVFKVSQEFIDLPVHMDFMRVDKANLVDRCRVSFADSDAFNAVCSVVDIPLIHMRKHPECEWPFLVTPIGYARNDICIAVEPALAELVKKDVVAELDSAKRAYRNAKDELLELKMKLDSIAVMPWYRRFISAIIFIGDWK